MIDLTNTAWSTGNERPFAETIQRMIDDPPVYDWMWLMSKDSYEKLHRGEVELVDLVLAGKAWKEPYRAGVKQDG